MPPTPILTYIKYIALGLTLLALSFIYETIATIGKLP